MSEVARFDLIKGSCAICEGPVYFSRVIDWEGNRVNSVHCWNGHYESLEVEHIEIPLDRALTTEDIEKILPFVGFVRLDDDNNKA